VYATSASQTTEEARVAAGDRQSIAMENPHRDAACKEDDRGRDQDRRERRMGLEVALTTYALVPV